MIRAVNLRHAIDEAASQSWEARPGVLPMSKISESPETLCQWFFAGQPTPGDNAILHEAHLGTVLERDIIHRLESQGIPLEHYGAEIVSSIDPVYTGHIDGIVSGELVEIVTCREEAFDRITKTKKLIRRKFLQIQNYMHELLHARPDDPWFNWLDPDNPAAKVIVLSRERGRCYVIALPYIQSVGEDCEDTAREALALIHERARREMYKGEMNEAREEGGHER